jgi:hypothetical protein
MAGEEHEGVVAFQPAALGRETILLGRVQVGEIVPIERGAVTASFRLLLPEASATSWRPARDITEARRLALIKINDWLNAAGVAPVGAIATATSARSDASSPARARGGVA